MSAHNAFAKRFAAFTGHMPLSWQGRLFEHLAASVIPGAVTLPTGLGKTSVIPIWLIALASGARLPRRLVYVVNRRTVVDQATADAKRLLARVYHSGQRDGLAWATQEAINARGLRQAWELSNEEAPVIAELCAGLAALSRDDGAAPLAVSTLRGELADNGEWKLNPARPAIIIGTVDMIGSKLLFSGYGDGRYGRAHHAGLIGQDALLVHDEAHLEPAFDDLLTTICEEQRRSGEARPIRMIRLSATTRPDRALGAPRGPAGESSDAAAECNSAKKFELAAEDQHDAVVRQRLDAAKHLRVIAAPKGTLSEKIVECALQLGSQPARVLVYVRSPETASKVLNALAKKLGARGESHVALLTGTIRGRERDALARGTVLSVFQSDPNRPAPNESVFLVSTSAGEVGADWDADHLVCDLSTLDSMAQRFGRVNRLGGNGRKAQIVVVMEGSAPRNAAREDGDDSGEGAGEGESTGKGGKAANAYEAAVLKTGEILRRAAADGGDVSPAGLGTVMANLSDADKQAAFSPEPKILPATDILFDSWALTSIAGEMPGRPIVEPYLHGVADWEPPESHVAWRADIALLAAAGGRDDEGRNIPCSTHELEQVFEAFPLRSAEQLRNRTDRVQNELRRIAERLRKAGQQPASEPADGDDSQISEADDQEDSRNQAAAPVWPFEPNPWVVLMRGGSVEWVRLEDIAPPDNDDAKRAQRRFAFATIVLPVEAGGLKDGMLKGDEPPPRDARSLDVAEIPETPEAYETPEAGQRIRQRVRVHANGNEVALLKGTVDTDMPTKQCITLRAGRDDGDELPDAAIVAIEYRLKKGDAGEPGRAVDLREHNTAVAEAAGRIAAALGLPDDQVRALELAGRRHDDGKNRAVWQRYARNDDPTNPPLAKNKRYRDPRSLSGYRHEFGSLHNAAAHDEIRTLDSDTHDLVLHLIAAHHGWARPHFEPRHFDLGDPERRRRSSDNERLAVEVMQRFGRLQQRYGRWGLAWLESILRCADAAASARASQSEPGGDRAGASSGGGKGAAPATAAGDAGAGGAA